MKKIVIVLISLFISLFLGGCTKKIENKIEVILPAGTPLIAVGGLLEEENVEYTVVSGADLLTTAMISKSHDIIIAPLTVGMKLFMNVSSIYKLYSIITLGNTYLVSRKSTTLDSISDVDGQDILAYGQNNVPDIILKAALEANNYEANITYQAGVNDIVPFFVCSTDNTEECDAPKYILSAEPTITTLEVKYGVELNIINLQDVMKEELSNIPQAAVFINPDSPYIKDIETFMSKLEKNIEQMNNKTDEYVDRIINLNDFFTKTGSDILKRSIPRSNIEYISAKDNKNIIIAYCNLLNKYNDKILGGLVVDEEIYY